MIIKYAGKDKEKRNIVRTRKRKLKDIDISLQYESSAKKLYCMLPNKVRNEIVLIDHQINPKLFSKFFVRNNTIVKEQITVEGHKYNLL